MPGITAGDGSVAVWPVVADRIAVVVVGAGRRWVRRAASWTVARYGRPAPAGTVVVSGSMSGCDDPASAARVAASACQAVPSHVVSDATCQ